MKIESAAMVLAVAALPVVAVAATADVFVGTAGVGHTVPAAAYPFGMLQPGPDTCAVPGEYKGDWAHCSGYQHGDEYVWRFSQYHISGMGVPAGGDFGFLPYVGAMSEVPPKAAKMLKNEERAEPGYYSVRLADGISCEASAGPRSAAWRFAFPANRRAMLLLDPGWGINGIDANGVFGRIVSAAVTRFRSPTEICGYVRKFDYVDYYFAFAARFSRPVLSKKLLRESDGLDGELWALDFGEIPGGVLEVRLSLSTSSESAAAKNLAADMPEFDFDGVRRRAAAAWDEWFARLVHDPATPPEVARNFAAAMYHVAFQPNLSGDVGDERYATFSLWDTFRAAHPLYTILAPEKVPAIVRSLMREGDEQGHLPLLSIRGKDTHCMIGHHSVPVIVDAFLKSGGKGGVDWRKAYAQVKDALTVEHVPASVACWGFLKEDWNLLNAHGYYPFDLLRTRTRLGLLVGESVSRTLECAYDDACASRFAAALGEKEDADFFARRSENWRNVFDAKSGYMRGKDSKGRWREPFDPYKMGAGPFLDNDFTEENAWQYTWHVMQNPLGLVAAMGGERTAGERLDALFSADSTRREREGYAFLPDVTGLIGQYAHGNEPGHHLAYFYQFTDRPRRTAEVLRTIFDTQYAAKPDGLCGNEDCGQMSAWYVFSALGFYPFDPCGGDYVIGAPQLPGATLRLPGGRTFAMRANGFSRDNLHVKAVRLNGKPLVGRVLRHSDVMSGGLLEFDMEK